jgi:hypothetical protein
LDSLEWRNGLSEYHIGNSCWNPGMRCKGDKLICFNKYIK